jgi:hypothetical protein
VLNGIVKPLVEARPALPARQMKDSESNFAEDDRIDRKVSLVVPQPVDHTLIPL